MLAKLTAIDSSCRIGLVAGHTERRRRALCQKLPLIDQHLEYEPHKRRRIDAQSKSLKLFIERLHQLIHLNPRNGLTAIARAAPIQPGECHSSSSSIERITT